MCQITKSTFRKKSVSLTEGDTCILQKYFLRKKEIRESLISTLIEKQEPNALVLSFLPLKYQEGQCRETNADT
jgi:hypothetical protein